MLKPRQAKCYGASGCSKKKSPRHRSWLEMRFWRSVKAAMWLCSKLPRNSKLWQRSTSRKPFMPLLRQQMEGSLSAELLTCFALARSHKWELEVGSGKWEVGDWGLVVGCSESRYVLLPTSHLPLPTSQ